MSIHFRDAREILNILRDVMSYILIQNRNDELGKRIVDRIAIILQDNDNTNVGDGDDSKT